jgi:hypothetical protein
MQFKCNTVIVFPVLYIENKRIILRPQTRKKININSTNCFKMKLSSINPGPKIIKLRLETSLKFQASHLLKWRTVAISANKVIKI